MFSFHCCVLLCHAKPTPESHHWCHGIEALSPLQLRFIAKESLCSSPAMWHPQVPEPEALVAEEWKGVEVTGIFNQVFCSLRGHRTHILPPPPNQRMTGTSASCTKVFRINTKRKCVTGHTETHSLNATRKWNIRPIQRPTIRLVTCTGHVNLDTWIFVQVRARCICCVYITNLAIGAGRWKTARITETRFVPLDLQHPSRIQSVPRDFVFQD